MIVTGDPTDLADAQLTAARESNPVGHRGDTGVAVRLPHPEDTRRMMVALYRIERPSTKARALQAREDPTPQQRQESEVRPVGVEPTDAVSRPGSRPGAYAIRLRPRRTVPGAGVEPAGALSSAGSEPAAYAIRLPRRELVPTPGIEPDPPALQTGARTTYARLARTRTARPGIRTRNLSVLSGVPLPVGPGGRVAGPQGLEP